MRVAPEWGTCQDERGTRSTTADATTFTLGWGSGWKENLRVSSNLELELASQTFMAESPGIRSLAILDQRGLGFGMGIDRALLGTTSWRMEASAAVGQSRTRSAATYADRQEEVQYEVPYGRVTAATGMVVPVTGLLAFTMMAGWRETHFAKTNEDVEVSGTRAKREGGLTLTYERVQPDERPSLRTPQKISGWLLRLGLEADL